MADQPKQGGSQGGQRPGGMPNQGGQQGGQRQSEQPKRDEPHKKEQDRNQTGLRDGIVRSANAGPSAHAVGAS